jgi:protein-disulfide isomerase
MLAISVTQWCPVGGWPCQARDPGAPFPGHQPVDLVMIHPRRAFGLTAFIALLLVAAAPARAGTAAATAAPAAGPPGTPDAARGQPGTQAPFNVLGSEDAPVAMVEFSDLQCPFCANYALHTFPQIKRAYIDTGRVTYAAVNFPLPMHAYAMPAAVAARCAGKQGKFWQYRDALYAAQAQLGSDPYDGLAGKMGLDVAKFKSCRRDVREDAAVREDLAMARQDGIASTPSFMIGRLVDGELRGETISGAKSFEEFAAKIDALLREAAKAP